MGETLKTRVTDDQRRGTGNYKGTVDAFVKIIKSEGPLGLYRGALPTILKQGTNQAVRMHVQVASIITFGDESKKQSPIYNGAAGFLAGCVSVLLTQPQDCAMKIMRNKGPAAFFSGA